MRASVVAGLALGLLWTASAVAPVRAEAPSAAPAPAPRRDLLLEMSRPTPPAAGDSVTADDLRDLPKPRNDVLPPNVHIMVVPGADPRCLPGEDLPLGGLRGMPPPRAR